MESVVFDILFNIFLGYVLARLIVWLVMKRMETKFEAEVQTLVDRIVDDILIPVTVEVEGNQYYCYNATSNEFVCQGVDLKEIAKNFHARFPSKKLALFNGDETALAILKKQAEELKNENSSSVRSTS